MPQTPPAAPAAPARAAQPLRRGATAFIAAAVLLWASLASGEEALFGNGFDPPPPDFCDHALVLPMGIDVIEKSWLQAFSSPNGLFLPNFPHSLPGPVPLGAGKDEALVVSFVPTENLSVNLSFDAAQVNGQYGYSSPRVANGGMFVGISECPVDLRPTHATASRFHTPACRRFNTSGGITYSTLPGSGAAVCRLTPGVTYYLTVTPHNPDADLLTETCWNSVFSGCDVQARHTALGM